VVANFSFIDPRLLPRAFHTKARAHCTITAPLGPLGLSYLLSPKTGEWFMTVARIFDIFYLSKAIQNSRKLSLCAAFRR
jgi:hypothetical protein